MQNAADRKDIRKAEKAAKLAERQRAEVITSIMVHAAGRQWLWERMAECSIFHTTHVPTDPLGSAYQEGRRSVGLSFLADIMAHCPDQFIQAMRENNERHLAAVSTAADPRSPSADPLAERPIGTEPDGGDLGAEPDSAAREAGTEAGWHPGRDIYVARPEGSTG